MDYSKYASLKKQKLSIDEKLIEYDGNTWQIKNLTKISLQRTVIPFDMAKPEFNEPQPSRSIKLIPALSFIAGGFFISVTFLLNWIYFITIAAALGTILYSLKQNKRKMDQWAKRNDAHEQCLKKWNEMRNDPQVVYSLSVEPDATSSPMFFTYEKSVIENIEKNIKVTMTQPQEQETVFNLKAIDIPEASTIEDTCISVYEKIAKEFNLEAV